MTFNLKKNPSNICRIFFAKIGIQISEGLMQNNSNKDGNNN